VAGMKKQNDHAEPTKVEHQKTVIIKINKEEVIFGKYFKSSFL